jgi:hypothetical protein
MRRNNFKKIFLEIDIRLNLLFITSVIYVTLYHVWLFKIPGVFPYSYEVGKVLEIIFISVVPAYIFYVITVHLPEFHRKIKVWIFISSELAKISVLIIRINDVIYRNANISKKFEKSYSDSLTDEQIKMCCQTIDPENSVSINVEYGEIEFENWFKLFDHFHNEIKFVKREIFLLDFNDNELIELISDLDRQTDIYFNRFKGNIVNVADGLVYFDDGIITLNMFRGKINDYKKNKSFYYN